MPIGLEAREAGATVEAGLDGDVVLDGEVELEEAGLVDPDAAEPVSCPPAWLAACPPAWLHPARTTMAMPEMRAVPTCVFMPL